MNITVTPRKLSGTINAIPSKSYAHRYLICAALADGESRINLTSASRDIEATAQCLRALGAGIEINGSQIAVKPVERSLPRKMPQLPCGESGSTLRFLAPVAAALGGAVFEMQGRLGERPMGALTEALCENGSACQSDGKLFSVAPGLRGGNFHIEGNISSQFITGLLLALPLLGGGAITLTTALESKPYVDITVGAMQSFGVRVVQENSVFSVVSNSVYRACDISVPGDWSNAAFWLACGVGVSGLDTQSAQGDRAVIAVMERMGAKIQTGSVIRALGLDTLRGCEIDARDIPDAVPVLAVLAAGAAGTTRIYNASRLRAKESDRIATTAAMLSALGVQVTTSSDGMIITGRERFAGCSIDCAGDHRIAMAAAVAATRATESVTLFGAQAVEKSYPAFWDDYRKLGGEIYVEHDRR